ncbi:DUF3574 domain-containing protein [Streptomyces sp. NPDC090022]|uniref:DUF3574 domain-containing protein n=1 Tax=Streptomyces sp. NPDC090022 TaxID=3365920 RepID=UPI00380ED708
MTWTTEARRKAGGGVLLALIGAGIPALVGALHGNTGEQYKETRLYFGTQKAHGGEVGERDFLRFLDREVTPAFPEGLTLQEGRGQWREADGDIVREQSYELVLLYPEKDAEERGVRIERIRRAYMDTFDQDSVGRSDDEVTVDF